MDLLAAYVAAGGSVTDAAELVGNRPGWLSVIQASGRGSVAALLERSAGVDGDLGLGLAHHPDEDGENRRAMPCPLHRPRAFIRVPPFAVDSRVAVRTQLIIPPFSYVHMRGRS